MKLRQALKIHNAVGTPAERPWKQNTIAAALRRYQKTKTSRDADAYWDYLMQLQRRYVKSKRFADRQEDDER